VNDVARWVAETSRDVRRGALSSGDGYAAVLQRNYDASVEDVWDAITTPRRLEQWFLPVSGDLRPGGTFQLEGNAHGEILECIPPHLFRVTWLYGDNPRNEVVARVSAAAGGGASLELEHGAPGQGEAAAGFILGVGPGWDPALVALGTYLRGEIPDKTWWETSPEARELIGRSIKAWSAVLNERGVASPDAVARAAEASIEMYLGGEAPPES
jgi:uncharacterized protein YndB with AHSA1/START domain